MWNGTARRKTGTSGPELGQKTKKRKRKGRMALNTRPKLCEGYLQDPTQYAMRCETLDRVCTFCGRSAEEHSKDIISTWVATLNELQGHRSMNNSLQNLSLSSTSTSSSSSTNQSSAAQIGGGSVVQSSNTNRRIKGVSLKFLKRFREEMEQELGAAYAEATLYNIKPKVQDKTNKPTHNTVINGKTYRGISYIELMEAQYPDEIADATHFISHTWAYLFEDTVQTIFDYFTDCVRPEEVFIWLDIFTINQVDDNMVAELITSWGNFGDFLKAPIDGIDKTLLILCKYHPQEEVVDATTGRKEFQFKRDSNGVKVAVGIDKPGPFLRVWCIFEIYHSLRQNKLNIAISNGEWQRLKQNLSNYDWINKMYANINVENGLAGNGTSPADVEVRDKILGILRGCEGGYNKVNIDIIDGIRSLMMKKVEEELVGINHHLDQLVKGTDEHKQEEVRWSKYTSCLAKLYADKCDSGCIKKAEVLTHSLNHSLTYLLTHLLTHRSFTSG